MLACKWVGCIEYRFLAYNEPNINITRNALYDITNHTYCDSFVQWTKKLYEYMTLNTMVVYYSDLVPAILMADCS